MGFGLALGNFLGGAADGYNKERKLAMEEERQGWERADQDEKSKIRGARDELLKTLNGIDIKSVSGELPGQPDNVIAQPAPAAEGQATPESQTQAISTPESVAAQGQAPAPQGNDSVQADLQNIFKQNGEGKYKNQNLANDAKYSAIRDAYAKYFVQIGQPEKVLDLDKKVNEMRESAYDPVRKAAAAAAWSGSPNTMSLLNKFSQAAGMGMTYEGGEFDAKTHTWNGVKVTGTDGKTRTENIPAVTIASVTGALTFDKSLDIYFARLDADRSAAQKDKQLSIEGRVADAKVAEAGATQAFRQAQTTALGDSIKGANTKALGDTLASQFPLANKEIDPAKAIGRDPKDLANRQRMIDDDTNGLAVAQRFAGLNPKVDPRIVAAAAKVSFSGGMAQHTDPGSGRKYIEYGGTKIFTN